MIRLFHHTCCRGCCDFKRHRREINNSSAAPPITTLCSISYLQVIVTKFVLEVMGASGAIWGCADILSLRDTTSGTERVRLIALFIGTIFFIRYWWHIKHYWQFERDYLPLKAHHRRSHRCAFFQIHASKFLLQVMGASGAIWGCSEAIALRNSENAMQWRIAAIVVGTIFLIRWALQILAYCLYFAAVWSNPSCKIARWCEELIVMLILEVFGAVGAIWGCSEVMTLRNPDNSVRIWRPILLSVGFVFLIRWIMHIKQFIHAESEPNTVNSQVQRDETNSDEVQDLEIANNDDLELKETNSTEDDWNEEDTLKAIHTSIEVQQSSPASLGTPTNPSTPLKRHKKQLESDYGSK